MIVFNVGEARANFSAIVYSLSSEISSALKVELQLDSISLINIIMLLNTLQLVLVIM